MLFKKYCIYFVEIFSLYVTMKADLKESGGFMYDVIIIGAGPCGIFSAYRLVEKNPKLKVLLLEKGSDLETRKKKNDIVYGFGGAGAFSDGKYNITTEFGGVIHNYLGIPKAYELMEEVDKINSKYGGDKAMLYDHTYPEIEREALKQDLHLLKAKVRHLGTDLNFEILTKIYDYLKDKVDIKFEEEAKDLEVKNGKYIITSDKGTYEAPYAIIGIGRSGSKWFNSVCERLNIELLKNKVDLGVRVEIPAVIGEEISNKIYEPKLMYRTKTYGDIVRTFCWNPCGYVVEEVVNGIKTVNGHSYSDPAKATSNTNFALLVSNTFTSPFNNSIEYGEHIARLSNMLGDGILVQRLGDLRKGRRTNEHRLTQSFLEPTLKNATPGDLSLVLPKRHLDNILEMIEALDKMFPGMNNDSTLLYGVEIKFFNSLIDVDNDFMCKNYKGLYVIGDGSAITHGLSQASASGLHVANKILETIDKK